LAQFPGYIDCHLRLALIARTSGDIEEAVAAATAATDLADGHIDAQALLATLYLERKWVTVVASHVASKPSLRRLHTTLRPFVAQNFKF